MASTDFNFVNASGRRLSGVLETGSYPVRAYAVFAHCFSCDKTSLAAMRLSRALADHGIGVLRFDFTDLSESQSDSGQGLSGDVQDIVCAVKAMEDADTPPHLLIGHSFGGAAVLAAAGSLEQVRAVAVIGAPFDAEHVLTRIGTTLDGAPDDHRVPVSIAGHDFCLRTGFVEHIRSHNQQARIAELGRALLVLHSPIDDVVAIDNASGIFQTARHPKSFVSLDQTDHFLRRKAHTDYAASMIAAWATPYLDLITEDVGTPVQGVRVEETREGKFQVRVVTPSTTFLADEPSSVGGLGSGPTPYDLLSAGLGACTAMTCRLYADHKAWPLESVVVEVGHTGKTATAPDRFVRKIVFHGALAIDQHARLLEIADRCPVHRTLTESAMVDTERLAYDIRGAGAQNRPEDHLRKMQETCASVDQTEDT